MMSVPSPQALNAQAKAYASMHAKGTYRFTAGRLLLKHCRHLLNEMKLLGHDVEWIEGDGWLSHDFTVRGPIASLTALDRCLKVAGEV